MPDTYAGYLLVASTGSAAISGLEHDGAGQGGPPSAAVMVGNRSVLSVVVLGAE